MSDLSYFTLRRDGAEEVLLPGELTHSSWSAKQIRGIAVAAALARATEGAAAELGNAALRPARFTLDLFSPVPVEPARLRTRVVREGRRLAVIDAEYLVGDRCVSRSSALLLAASQAAPGRVWSANRVRPVPPAGVSSPNSDGRLYHTQAGGWQVARDLTADERTCTWNFAIPVVSGEQITPFQFAAAVADTSNLVANWGDGPLMYINADVTMSMTRLPSGLEMGLAVTDWKQSDGITIGSVDMYDRAGVFGTTTVSGLANERRAVDPGAIRKGSGG